MLAGPPSVAHAEALLRAIELRRATLDEPLDALVIGIPATTPFLPREQPNPLLAAHLGLAHALGLWRDAFPVRDDGIVILVHGFRRTFPRPTQQPYRVFFRSDPIARDPELPERRGGRRRRGRARDRGVPRRAHRPPAAAVSRLGGVPPRARAARCRLRRRRPGRGGSAAARLRPDRVDRRGAPDGAAATAVPTPRSASFSRRLSFRFASAQARRKPRTSAAAAVSPPATSSTFTETSRNADAARSKSVTFSHCDSNVDHQRSPAASPCFCTERTPAAA